MTHRAIIVCALGIAVLIVAYCAATWSPRNEIGGPSDFPPAEAYDLAVSSPENQPDGDIRSSTNSASTSLLVVDERSRPIPRALVIPMFQDCVVVKSDSDSTMSVADNRGLVNLPNERRGETVTVWRAGFAPRDIRLDNAKNRITLPRANELLVNVASDSRCPFAITLHRDVLDQVDANAPEVSARQEFAVLRRGTDGLPYVSSIRALSDGTSISVGGLSHGLHICSIDPLEIGFLVDSDCEWHLLGVTIPSAPLQIGFCEAVAAIVNTGGARFASWSLASQSRITDYTYIQRMKRHLQAAHPTCEIVVARKVLQTKDPETGDSRGAVLQVYHDSSGWSRTLFDAIPFRSAKVQHLAPPDAETSRVSKVVTVLLQCVQPSGEDIRGVRLAVHGKTRPGIKKNDFSVSARSGGTLALPPGKYTVETPDALTRDAFSPMNFEVRAADASTTVAMLAKYPIWTFSLDVVDKRSGNKVAGGSLVMRHPSAKYRVLRDLRDLDEMTCLATAPVVDVVVRAFGYGTKQCSLRQSDVGNDGRLSLVLTRSRAQ